MIRTVKPYYDLDGITLYQGDSREIVPQLLAAGVWADAIVTDPPYNETALEWDTWVKGWPSLVADLSHSMWCFGSMRMFWNRVSEFKDWKLSQDIIWEKQNGSSLRTDRFRRIHEMALHFYQGSWEAVYKKTPVTMDAQKITANRRKKPKHWSGIGDARFQSEEGGPRLMQSIIYARNCQGFAVNETQKPAGIVAPLVEYAVPPGGLVVDLFAGSGVTLLAARAQGKRAIGIEKRESQCREIVRQLAQSEMILTP